MGAKVAALRPIINRAQEIQVMKKTLLLLSVILAGTVIADNKKPAAPAKKPRIEVCFVLDTTGSMSGLIAGAKQKIWAVANMMISGKPKPDIHIGLIGYRDRGDAYVTKTFPLSNDIDDIYTKLMAFQAQGGGDTPESVNQALHEAVHKMKWSKSKDVLKVIFLVGDAPPHMDYPQDIKYAVTCEQAAKANIIINTIQCGKMAATTPVWKEIAAKAEGKFNQILQDGGVLAMTTPFDKEIAECNVALGHTVCFYGDARAQRFAASKLRTATTASGEAAADRLEFLSKAKKDSEASAEVITGGGDLTALLANKKITLKDIDEKKLPENVRKMKPKEREAYFAKQLKEREKAQAQLADLLKKRNAFIAKETARLKKEGKLKGFDAQVQNLIREQAAPKGIAY